MRLTVIVVAPAGRPAAVLSAETLRRGVKPNVQPWSIVKVAVAVLAAVPLQGVSRASSCLAPHVCGLARTACGPPLKLSAKVVNGTCGRLSKTVVIWPVSGSSFVVAGELHQ